MNFKIHQMNKILIKLVRFSIFGAIGILSSIAQAQTGIAGSIKSSVGSAPLEAQLYCYSKLVDEFSGEITWSGPVLARSGPNGDFSIDLSEGVYRIEFAGNVNGYPFRQWHAHGTDLDSATDVVLTPGAITRIDLTTNTGSCIAGRVVHAVDGSYVSDLGVVAWRWDEERAFWYEDAYDYTDVDGKYFITGLDPGIYRIQFVGDSHGYPSEYYDNAVDIEAAIDVVVQSATSITGIDAQMSESEFPGGAIVGTVVGPDETGPLSNVYVEAWRLDQTSGSWQQVRVASTEADGSYRLISLSPGTYRVHFSGESHGYLSEYYDDGIGSHTAENIVVVNNHSIVSGINAELNSPLSSTASLAALSLSPGLSVPAFSPGTTNYSVTVANSVATTSVTPTVTQPNATVRVNGATVVSGESSAFIPLIVGANTIIVEVTAQDGSTRQTYTITVTRKKSSNALLNKLVVKDGILTPKFAPKRFAYKATVPEAFDSVKVQATAADPKAGIRINGKKIASGSTAKPIRLKKGKTPIVIIVKAQNGSQKTYKVTVKKSAKPK